MKGAPRGRSPNNDAPPIGSQSSAAQPQPNGPRPFWAQRLRMPRCAPDYSRAQSLAHTLRPGRPRSGTGTAPILGAARWRGSEGSQNPARLRTPRVLPPARPRSGKSSRRAKIFAERDYGAPDHGQKNTVAWKTSELKLRDEIGCDRIKICRDTQPVVQLFSPAAEVLSLAIDAVR